MGNAASSADGSPSGGGDDALRLQQAFLSGLSNAEVKARLSSVSSDAALMSYKLAGAALDPSNPNVAALIRLGTAADPGLNQRFTAETKSGAVSPSVFWSSYAACVKHVLENASANGSTQRPATANKAEKPSGDKVSNSHGDGSKPAAVLDNGVTKVATEAVNEDPKTSANGPASVDDDDEEEEVLLWSTDECFVYKLPPRPGASGYVAAAWGLDKPVLENTYVRATAGGGNVTVAVWQKPQDSSIAATNKKPAASAPSGSNKGQINYTVATAPAASGHKLVAACVIPASAQKRQAAAGGKAFDPADGASDGAHLAHYLEPVLDSSRYFVARISRGGSGDGKSGGSSAQTGLLGLGFRDRDPAYALKASILDHLAFCRRQARPAAGLDSVSAAVVDPLAASQAAALDAALAGVSLDASVKDPSAGAARIQIDPTLFGRKKPGAPASGTAGSGATAPLPASGASGERSSTTPAKLLLPPPRAAAAAPVEAPKKEVVADKAADAAPAAAEQPADDEDWGEFT